MNKVLGASLFASMALLGACASDSETQKSESGGASSVTGTVKEWEVNVDPTSVQAGEVTFTITNEGTIEHEFLVVKTDLAPGEIPVEGDHFSENLDSISVIDEIGEYAAGTTEALTVTLEAGNYQLVCNIPGHYQSGMHTAFIVE